jgi:transcriptional regulator with XRE-family HTH domain
MTTREHRSMRANDAREAARRKKVFADGIRTLLGATAATIAADLGISQSAMYALAQRSRPQMPSAGRLRRLALTCEAEAERLTLAARTLLQESYRIDALRK